MIRRHHIQPIFTANNRQSYMVGMSSPIFNNIKNFQRKIADDRKSFAVMGVCIPCNKRVLFKVDQIAGKRSRSGTFLPNWRERMLCPHCKMSNRQRLMATLIIQQLEGTKHQRIYLMEQMTSLYGWVDSNVRGHIIIGSEYLGTHFHSGKTVKAWNYCVPIRLDSFFTSILYRARLFYDMFRIGEIRHENAESLSFRNNSLDMIISNDVFEHVQNPTKAFLECARVLRPGGVMLASVPFHHDTAVSIKRVDSRKNELVHLLPPIYHGNPLSGSGSLVFTDFGWDLIQSFREAGFSDVAVEVYASAKFGHLGGGGQLIFRMKR